MAYRLTCGMIARPERKVWAKRGMSKHGQAPIPQWKHSSYMHGQRLVNSGMLAQRQQQHSVFVHLIFKLFPSFNMHKSIRNISAFLPKAATAAYG